MSVVDEEILARSKKNSSKVERNSRRDTDAGGESRNSGNQQERISGADGTEQSFFGDRNPVTGGILRQLIEEYTNQLAHENEQKKQIEAKIERIDSRVQEFTSLLKELEANKKN